MCNDQCPTCIELARELERAKGLIAVYVLETESADLAKKLRRKRLKDWAAQGGITGPFVPGEALDD